MQRPYNFIEFVIDHNPEIMIPFAKAEEYKNEEADDILRSNFYTYSEHFFSLLTKEYREEYNRQKEIAEKEYHAAFESESETSYTLAEKMQQSQIQDGPLSQAYQIARRLYDEAFDAYQKAGRSAFICFQRRLLSIWIDLFRKNYC